MLITISQPIEPYLELSRDNEFYNPWKYYACDSEEDEYTKIDGISKKLRELIVDVDKRTEAKEWNLRKEEFMGEKSFYIDFVYEYEPKAFTQNERRKLFAEFKKHAISSECLCDEYKGFSRMGNKVKKCENCINYTQFDNFSFICGKNSEELSWAFQKLDVQEKLFKIKKSVEIELITKEYAQKLSTKEKICK